MRVFRVVWVRVRGASSAKVYLVLMFVVSVGMGGRTSGRASVCLDGGRRTANRSGTGSGTGSGSRGLLYCRSINNRGRGDNSGSCGGLALGISPTLDKINPVSTSGKGRDGRDGEDSDKSESGLGRHNDDDLN